MINVLKLFTIYWRYQLRKGFISINYCLLYERENHIINPVYQTSGQFKAIIKHEDMVDRQIINHLFIHFKSLSDIEDFTFTEHEFVLFPDHEAQYRAIISNYRPWYNLGDLQINTNTNRILNCATRTMFNGYEEYLDLVRPMLPHALNLDMQGNIPTLLRSEF